MMKKVCVKLVLLLLVMELSAAFGNSTKLELGAEACATVTLSFGFYLNSCPEAEAIIFSWVEKAVSDDPRMPASLLRLHFHDCIVNASLHQLILITPIA